MQIKERMDRGITDIGLLLEPIDIEKYEFIRLAIKEKWVVLMRPDDPLTKKDFITAEDLEDMPIIMARRASVQNELASWFWDKTKICYRPLSPELAAATVLACKCQQSFSLATAKFIDYIKCFLSMGKA